MSVLKDWRELWEKNKPSLPKFDAGSKGNGLVYISLRFGSGFMG